MSKRTIVFGDVHGCLDELTDLLRAARVTDDDLLVSVGDLISKGPDSRGVMDWARSRPNLRIVLGNHELRFLTAWRAGRKPAEKEYDAETVAQLGAKFDEDMAFLSGRPYFLDLPEALVVHGGFDPRLGGPERFAPEVLANLRKLEDETPWYERYSAEKPVVFGHWVHRAPIVRPNAIGLDTGCVFGGSLTAVILPERRLVSVAARKAYKQRSSWI